VCHFAQAPDEGSTRLEDVLLLLLAAFLIPVGILLIGSPIALARLVRELVRRLY
jgi:hypothetical protein